jgi:hypothetical protein
VNDAASSPVLTEYAKFTGSYPACIPTTFEVRPFHNEVGMINVFEIDFKFAVALAINTDTIEIDFPTHNGVRELFKPDLGLGVSAALSSSAIDCYLKDPAGAVGSGVDALC